MRIQTNLNPHQPNNINFKALGFPEGFAKIETNCLKPENFNLLINKATYYINGYESLPQNYKSQIEQCLVIEQHLSNVILKQNEANELNSLVLKEDPEEFTKKTIEIIKSCKRLLKADLFDMNNEFTYMSLSLYIDKRGKPFYKIIQDTERVSKEISKRIAKKLDES